MSTRAAAMQFDCPTCHAREGEPCLRSPGRHGRRRTAARRAPHLARHELATSFIEEGRSPGLRRLAELGRSSSVPQSAPVAHAAAV